MLIGSEEAELRARHIGRRYAHRDAEGAIVTPVEAFFAELQAKSRRATTIRSYGMDLLRWWRFLSGWGVAWDRLSRRDARDFTRWVQIAPKVSRVHWRRRASGEGPKPMTRPAAGMPNPGHGAGSAGPAVLGVDAGALRNCAEVVLRLPSGGGHRPGHQPVCRSAGTPPVAGGNWPDSPAMGGRQVPAVPSSASTAAVARRLLQRAVRRATLQPRPCSSGLLGVQRGPGQRTADQSAA
ncbi:site-specific integrase [Streptomyces sp. NPDC048304]|uniref:site-specific integrase n=1 Tax=Streptomyces sp. NPDC048304 TaxID=3154820 RepID=UPI0033D29722